jgi:hypothetical protein
MQLLKKLFLKISIAREAGGDKVDTNVWLPMDGSGLLRSCTTGEFYYWLQLVLDLDHYFPSYQPEHPYLDEITIHAAVGGFKQGLLTRMRCFISGGDVESVLHIFSHYASSNA